MSRLYDRASGKWYDVPDEDVTKLVGSGTHAFEQGIDIPVVSPDGQLGTLPSEEVERAFREGGYRWQTKEDMKAWEQSQNDAIKQEHFGNALEAFNQGAVRGLTMGTSDVIMPAMAGMMGGNPDDIKQALQTQRELSPIASGAGQVLGTVANPLLGAVGKAAYEGGAAAGTALTSGLAEAGAAGKIVSAIAPTAVGSAVEGAFFGLGDGISEAALGDPNDIAENLAAGVATGGVLGGGFGALFGAGKAAAAPIKELIGKASETFNDVTKAGMRATARAGLVPTLSIAGEKELAGIVKDMTAEGSELVRQAYFSGGKEAAEKIAKQVTEAEGQVAGKAKSLKQQLGYAIQKYPKRIREQIGRDVDQFRGDLSQALEQNYQRYVGQKTAFETALTQDMTPAANQDLFEKSTNSLIKSLRDIGETRGLQKAKELEEYIQGQKLRQKRAFYNKDGLPTGLTEGQRVQIATELRNIADNNVWKFSDANQRLLKNYVSKLTDQIYEHPQFGAAARQLDDYYGAFDGVRKFASGVAKNVEKRAAKASILQRVQKDPEFANQFDKVLDHFAEIVPDIDAYRKGARNLQSREAALRSMTDKVNATMDRTGGSKFLTVDDMEDIAKEFNSPQMLNKATDLREMLAVLQAEGQGPFTRGARLYKALGKDLTPEMQQFGHFDDGFAKLTKLAPQQSSPDYMKDILMRMGRKMVHGAVGETVGSLIAGPIGGAMGRAAAQGLNPENVLRTLTALERASNKSFKVVEDASKRAVDFLTSEGARKVTNIAVAQSGRGIEEKRKDFHQRAKLLTDLQDPAKRLEAIQERFGDVPGAPNVKASLARQYSRTVDFLTSKLPVDPLQGKTMVVQHSPWTPSDVELSRFERYAEAAENPVRVLENISKGIVSPEEIETLETLYPQMYKRLQENVTNAIIQPNAKLSYLQRLQIGTLLKIPADATLDPTFITAMQSNFASQQQQGGRPQGSSSAGQPVPRPGQLDVSSRATPTETQQISES